LFFTTTLPVATIIPTNTDKLHYNVNNSTIQTNLVTMYIKLLLSD